MISTSAAPLYDGQAMRAVDCGDVRGRSSRHPEPYDRAEQAVRRILDAARCRSCWAATTASRSRCCARSGGPITLIQIDQHIDWRDEVNGVRDGLSSPIRRASEMAHIGEIFQIGLRATGSARTEEVEAARAYGAHLITAYELHDAGMDAILARIPDGGRYYITLDMDGMDPAARRRWPRRVPAGSPSCRRGKLIHGLVQKGRVVGMDVVEITPSTDVNRITCITAGRLIVNLIGAADARGVFPDVRGWGILAGDNGRLHNGPDAPRGAGQHACDSRPAFGARRSGRAADRHRHDADQSRPDDDHDRGRVHLRQPGLQRADADAEDQTVHPDLAGKWEYSEDLKRWTFHLRKGVKFHDGSEMTSADVSRCSAACWTRRTPRRRAATTTWSPRVDAPDRPHRRVHAQLPRMAGSPTSCRTGR